MENKTSREKSKGEERIFDFENCLKYFIQSITSSLSVPCLKDWQLL